MLKAPKIPTSSLALVLFVACLPIGLKGQAIPHQAPERYFAGKGNTLSLIAFEEHANARILASPETAAVIRSDLGGSPALEVTTEPVTNQYPGVSLMGPDGGWDLSNWQFINLEVENLGDHRLSLGLRADNPGADEDASLRTFAINEFAPGERKTLSLRLSATEWRLEPPIDLVGMREAPGQAAIDPTNVVKLILFSVRPEHNERFLIRNVRAEGEMTPFDSDAFLPFMDQFGQFKHRDWPGKAKSNEDLLRQRDEEASELAAHPGPSNFNQYGGWASGPQLEATGHFRVTKHEGKWWLVDPDGRLFFSTGPDCVDVRFGGSTGVEHRESYFEWLPEESHPLAVHYQINSGWAPHGFYKDKLPYRMFDFHNANLERKYGPEWRAEFGDLAHQRIRSWGMNTIAAWGDPEIYRQQKTAYTTHVWVSGGPTIQGSTGYWGQFPDPFDPEFRETARASLGEYTFEATDPWNIGYYVDNEKAWGDDTELALATLASPADQAAKVALVEDLKVHHRNVDALNAAWGSDYASWEDVLERRERPEDIGRARPDLKRFYLRLAETYFRVIKEELEAIAPDKLYLGCRFAWRNDSAVWASAMYCDVVSYNAYKYSLAELRLPDGIDRPLIIGEFSFGAPDAGGFPSTNTKARDQAHRGELYEAYVESALQNPQIVGVHWFQYTDQSPAGRPDEENFNIGMVSVTDHPFAPLIESMRRVGETMYEIRAKVD